MSLSQQFFTGQRWISTTEPELGIGRVITVDKRFVGVEFPSHKSVRKYTIADAPLKRLLFTPGETVKDRTGKRYTVHSVSEHEHTRLVTYTTETGEICETDLSDAMNISAPDKRFLAGIADSNADFQLRYSMVNYRASIRGAAVRGFAGGRIDLLPHQLYIAGTVANRKIPRALLSDETGLGKTIEAALILHRLLCTGRAERVLILVPESLVHQWFVELLRRFNTLCTLITDEILDDEDAADVFMEEQLFIADMSKLAGNQRRAAQAIAAHWDLVIIDEVHHVRQGSPASDLLESLAARECGLLLLSATPEQFGEKNHFFRLQLLDPERFRNWAEYQKEKESMQHISGHIDAFIEAQHADVAHVNHDEFMVPLPQVARDRMPVDVASRGENTACDTVSLSSLIDLYAMGRVQFRNTRRVVKGFPGRVVSPVALQGDNGMLVQIISDVAKCHTMNTGVIPMKHVDKDPRVSWLSELIKKLHCKLLVICGSKETTIYLQSSLQKLVRIDIAVFHEDMTLIQRDRQAAWFEEEDGAAVLISSESGSEGRNFQFCSNLVLFDLPWNPELLEQRIGRLDRIGQGAKIILYVPYIERTAHELLFRWYHEGVGAFEANIPAAGEVFEELESQLFACANINPDTQEFNQTVDPLLNETRQRCAYLSETLFNHRDRLLELSSYRPAQADTLLKAIKTHDQELIASRITHTLFKHYGIVVEEAGSGRFLMNTEYLTDHAFPLPRIERPMITFDRSLARTREDVEFLTIDHPMITGALDLYLSSDHGISAFALWRDENLMELVVESIFILECIAPPSLYTDRFLPPLPLRVVVNHTGMDVTDIYTSEMCEKNCENGPVSRLLAVKSLVDTLSRMKKKSTEIAGNSMESIVLNAIVSSDIFYNAEIARLHHMQMQGAPLAAREKELLISERKDVQNCLRESRLRLECMRVIRRGPVKDESGSKS